MHLITGTNRPPAALLCVAGMVLFQVQASTRADGQRFLEPADYATGKNHSPSLNRTAAGDWIS